MAPAESPSGRPGPDPIQRAEESFLAMVRTPEFAGYLSRMVEATDDELRSLFGLAMAALRQATRPTPASLPGARPASGGDAARHSRADLEAQVRQLAAALAQRDEHIRALKSELELRRRSG